MPSTKTHRPPFRSSLLWYLPVLALVVVAIFVLHPLVLIPLLLADALAMAALCHATGFGPEPGFGHMVLRRGAAWLVLFTAYTALVWLLVALPMVTLAAATPLPGAISMAVALAIALGVLWWAWPAFGLIVLWDDAIAPPGQGSWILTALKRSLAFANHLASEQRFFTQYLPAALALLVLSAGALLLSGLYAVVPTELRTAALWLYGLIVLPACCLVVADRTLRMLLPARGAHPGPAPAPDPPGGMRERSGGLAETPQLSPHDTLPGVRDPALLQATREGDVARALALLDAGANPDTLPAEADADQRTPLMLAALQPTTRLLRALIAHGADINLCHRRMTALIAVTRDGCTSRAEAVMVLLANGADIGACDADGNTALHHAARSTEVSVAADLVGAGAPLDRLNRQGLGPLAIACRAANWAMAEWLLHAGAPAHVTGGEPPLVAAANIADDDPTGVALLLRHKAAVNARDGLGRSALMAAALEGHAGIAGCLLDAHADVNAQDAHGTTALMEAARTGATDVVAALCDAGADPALRDRHGRDALALACLSTRAGAATVATLIAAGADARAHAPESHSALEYATDAGRWDLVAVLDPTTELPASIAAARAPDPEAASPDHLLDALRFDHWAIVGSFAARVREWPAHERARLYLVLADGSHSRACAWMLDHGLAADDRLADGRRLFAALLEALPASAHALSMLMAAGAAPTGAGVLARAMQHAAAAPAIGVPLVQAMLAAGADPFGALEDGRTPLHLATAPGWQAVLEVLADAGLDPNARDAGGCTPLHAALAQAAPAVAVARTLIAAGADPEISHANGETPLGLAMASTAHALVRWLRWTPWVLPCRRLRADDLPAAAAAGDAEAVGKLLELGFDVDTPDARGACALVYACGGGHRDVALRLLGAGADTGRVATTGVTALVAAVNRRQLEMVPLLVEHGARVDQRLAGGITALMVASAEGHADVASALIAAGADVNAADARGRTPLAVAAQCCFASHDSLRSRRLLDVLLKAGADVNRIDANGLTPLLALLGAHAQPGADCDATDLGALLPVLLDAGARHEHADARGITALHACAMHALLAPARILLQRGADRGAVDAFDRRSADVARQLGYTDIAMELDDRLHGFAGMHASTRTPARPAE